MTRTAAREIAVHFAFELGFTGQTAEELDDMGLFWYEFDLENLFVLNGRSCNAFRTESDAKITADHRKNLVCGSNFHIRRKPKVVFVEKPDIQIIGSGAGRKGYKGKIRKFL